VPLLCSFNLRLFTRERLPSQTTTQPQHVAGLVPVETRGGETGGRATPGLEGRRVGCLTAARPACSRVLRVEPLTHTVMTSPGWRTLLLTWNDYTQSWIKTGNSLVLLP